jgi:hypothetical protein
MRLILKIVAMPFALALTVMTAIFNFLLSVSAIFFGIASVLVSLGAVILFITGEPTGGIAFMVVAFLVSPFGLLALAGRLVGLMDGAGGALRGFIAG